ncbi:MAG: hypothetical protein Kow0075_16330 [Salibacteraceae bacterium]
MGKVFDRYTHEPLPGVELLLGYARLENGSFSSATTDIGYTVTDEDGNYRFEFDPVSAYEYRLTATRDGYFHERLTVGIDDVHSGALNVYDFDMAAESRVKVNLYDSENEYDQLVFTFLPHSEGCDVCCHTEPVVVKNDTDTVFECRVHGNQYLSYRLNYIGPGSAQTVEREVYAPAGQFEIEVAY